MCSLSLLCELLQIALIVYLASSNVAMVNADPKYGSVMAEKTVQMVAMRKAVSLQASVELLTMVYSFK